MWRNVGEVGRSMLAGILVVATGWTQQQQPAPQREQAAPQVGGAEVVSETDTVVKVDKARRKVTLQDPQGKQFTVQAGSAISNFDQIREGDKVDVKFYQALVIALHKPGESAPAMEIQEGAARAQAGRPAGMVGATVTANMSIISVDPAHNKLTLKTPDGKIQTLEVKDPDVQKRLSTLKPGDQVSISYTEAVALALAPQK